METRNSLDNVEEIKQLLETFWVNGNTKPADQGIEHSGLTLEDALDAELRLKRFAPLLAEAFPELAPTGIIESKVVPIPNMKAELASTSGQGEIPGQLWLKLDSHLPVSGSIKARGGIYEVLAHAEKLALEKGLLQVSDDYSKLLSPPFREFFSKHKIAVGSTGNLGLSIGIMSARLGFHVTVHMSADARQWKKDMLRERGAEVVEHAEDYGFAVEKGREAAENDPSCFFIDDENSKTLFLGYSVAGLRMKNQLSKEGIMVDHDHPLFVYLPCGVGGGPGGVSFGLKLVFGDNVHCFFAEPTNSPCMTLGLATGLHDQISVQELGISNKTVADGLAVGRASGFVGRAMEQLMDGSYTLSDQRMFRMLAQLNKSEGIELEPSALAGMYGPVLLPQKDSYWKLHPGLREKLGNSTHLVWATGGSMVPKEIMAGYLAQGLKELDEASN